MLDGFQVGSSGLSYLCKINVSSVVGTALGKLNIKWCCTGKRGLLPPELAVKAMALGLGFGVLRQTGFLSDHH